MFTVFGQECKDWLFQRGQRGYMKNFIPVCLADINFQLGFLNKLILEKCLRLHEESFSPG